MDVIPSYQQAEHPRRISRSEFDVFDRNPDPALDELTELAAVLSLADFAYTGWTDINRLWFKSRFGFTATDQDLCSTGCRWVVETGQPMIVCDAAMDPRFASDGIDVPGGVPCRSYAGVPLMTGNQHVLGTLAVLARKPNQFRMEHVTLLEVLGRQIVTRLELYNRTRTQEQLQRARQRTERALAMERCFVAATLDSIPALVAVLDTAGRLVRFNQPCGQLTGLSLADAAGRPFVEAVLQGDDRHHRQPEFIDHLHRLEKDGIRMRGGLGKKILQLG